MVLVKMSKTVNICIVIKQLHCREKNQNLHLITKTFKQVLLFNTFQTFFYNEVTYQ